jgi:hypothetical protein
MLVIEFTGNGLKEKQPIRTVLQKNGDQIARPRWYGRCFEQSRASFEQVRDAHQKETTRI